MTLKSTKDGSITWEESEAKPLFGVASKRDGGEWSLVSGLFHTREEAFARATDTKTPVDMSWQIIEVLGVEGSPAPRLCTL